MNCPKCATEVSQDSKYCPSCGTSVTLHDMAPTGAGMTMGAEPPSTGSLGPGKIIGERYRILATIGMGGMGMVYKALDLQLSVPVALKVIRSEYVGNEKILERFKKEITIARKVTHKNVARIYDFGESDGVKYISMEFIEGEDLAHLIERDGAIESEKAISIFRQSCAALAEAHAQGVVHRDLKPHNVMLDSRGHVYLMDFGIAMSQESRGLTKTGAILGTAEYMSPEQAEGKPTDHRSDIYSLGVTFYEALTGTVPFGGDTQWQVIRKHLQERPRPLRKIRSEIPTWIETLILKCMEKDPAHRYQQVNEIVGDLGREKATRLTVALLPDRKKIRSGLWALIIAVIAAGATAIFLWPQGGFTPGLGGRVSVAVLPFDNMAGREDLNWLRTGFAENLTSDLGQSKLLRVMSRDRLSQILGDLGLEPGEPVDGDMLAGLGDFGHVQAVFSGSYVASGGNLRVNLVARDPDSGEVIGSAVVPGAEGDVLAMIDKLTVRAKEILSLTSDQIEADVDQQIAAARTSSVEAASLFQLGVDLLYDGRNLEAVKPLEQATEIDPDFALAWARLSVVYQNLGYDDKARDAGQTALSRVLKALDTATAADRSFIRATHASAAQDRQEEIAAHTEMVESDPFDATFAHNLGIAYERSGQWNQAQAFFEKAIELDRNYTLAHVALAQINDRLGAPRESLRAYGDALEIYRKLGNREGEATTLQSLCESNISLGQWDDALENCESAREIQEEIGDTRGRANSLDSKGYIFQVTGKLDEATVAAREALRLSREIGDARGTAVYLVNLASVLDDRGELAEALALRTESLELLEEVGDRAGQSEVLQNLASTQLQMGALDDAGQNLEAAAALYSELQIEDGIAQVLSDRGLLALARNDVKEADRLLSSALGRWEEMEILDGVIETRYRQARVALARGNHAETVRLASEALTGYEDLEDRLNVTRCRLVLGRAHLLAGDAAAAAAAFDGAEEEARRLGNVILLAGLEAGRAELALKAGDTGAARPLVDSVCDRADGSGLAPLREECDALREKIPG